MSVIRTGVAARRATPELTFDRTIPRHLVHRRSVAEVLVTDTKQTSPHHFSVAVQVPRAHLLWADRTGSHHDPMGVVEAGRQGAIAVAHRYYGVPSSGVVGASHDVTFQVTDAEALREVAMEPLEGVIEVSLTDTTMRAETLVGLTFAGQFGVRGRPALTLGGSLMFVSTADFRMMRDQARARKPLPDRPVPAPARTLDPATGRTNPRNVVLGEPVGGTDGRWCFPLVADEGHPSFYDHELDHLPGPLLAEAMRQAALLTAHREVATGPKPSYLTAARAEFMDFVEPEGACTVEAKVAGTSGEKVTVGVEVIQFDQTVCTGSIELSVVVDGVGELSTDA